MQERRRRRRPSEARSTWQGCCSRYSLTMPATKTGTAEPTLEDKRELRREILSVTFAEVVSSHTNDQDGQRKTVQMSGSERATCGPASIVGVVCRQHLPLTIASVLSRFCSAEAPLVMTGVMK